MAPLVYRLLLPVLLFDGSGALFFSGWSSRYDPGVMAATVAVRVEFDQLAAADVDQVDGFVAVRDCHHLGRRLWVLVNDGRHLETDELVESGRFRQVLVADCAVRDGSDGARDWMTENNILTELGFELAAEYGYTGTGVVPILITWEEPSLLPH